MLQASEADYDYRCNLDNVTSKRGPQQISSVHFVFQAAQLSHVELLHLLFNLTTLWSIGDFEASDGLASKGGNAYYVRISIILMLFSGMVSPNGFL